MSEHSLVLDIVIRLLRLLGCPHACGEKMVHHHHHHPPNPLTTIIIIITIRMHAERIWNYPDIFFETMQLKQGC